MADILKMGCNFVNWRGIAWRKADSLYLGPTKAKKSGLLKSKREGGIFRYLTHSQKPPNIQDHACDTISWSSMNICTCFSQAIGKTPRIMNNFRHYLRNKNYIFLRKQKLPCTSSRLSHFNDYCIFALELFINYNNLVEVSPFA